MRIDLGLVFGILLEYLFFLYYADTLFYRKKNKYICYLIIAVGYFVHLIGCTFGNIVFNTAIFTAVNIICFILCYHISLKNALLQSAVLVILSIMCEGLIVFIPYINIIPDTRVMITATQSMLLTLTSKSLYLIGLLIINKLFFKDKHNYGTPSPILISVPIITIIIFLLIFKTNITSNLLSIACFLLILINCIILLINKNIINKDLEIKYLKSEKDRENLLLEEHLLLKEKYEKINILHHDFKEHMNALNSLIEKDNRKAREYIKSIYKEEISSQFIEYTDNNMLNILLMKKKEECQIKNIDFNIDPIQAHMSCFNDMDIVSLFSNLLNNAIEGCINSTEKKIFLNIHTSNENFIVITLENTSDIKPMVIDGKLRTHKDNKNLHGIGMNSIRNIAKKYNGYLNWEYKQTEHIFRTNIIIQNYIANDTTQAI